MQHWDFGVNQLASVVHPPRSGGGPSHSFGLQANLFLNDRGADGGASCVNSGYIQHHAAWIGSAQGKRELDRMAAEGKQHPKMVNVPGRRVNVAAEAGDLLIWHRMTPHSSSRNTAEDCRLALFFTLHPVTAEGRQAHASSWCRQWAALGGDALASSVLGRRLAGLDAWPA